MAMKAQGAIESQSAATARPRLGQGATEYLVLLAVVLIVALISVALLGFFPGMASDAQITQSQMYWRSASPISIVEMDAKYYGGFTAPYIRVRNVGGYPIRITKMLGNGYSIDTLGAAGLISNIFYLAPGEESYFAIIELYGVPQQRIFYFSNYSGGWVLNGADSLCGTSPGRDTVVMKNFGFEYIEYIDNQQITKRQVGAKPLIIKCSG